MNGPIAATVIVGRATEALRAVVDPELGNDVVALGLVYDIDVGDDGAVVVAMTLTTPGCPVAEQLPAEAHAAVSAALPDRAVEVRVVWDPPWSPDRMSTDAWPVPGAVVGRPRRRGRP
ncbi:MAG: metal-sulfur cluster assembly factor [Desertimonas sp.]